MVVIHNMRGFTCYVRLMIHLIILFISSNDTMRGRYSPVKLCNRDTHSFLLSSQAKFNSVGQRKPTLSRSFHERKS